METEHPVRVAGQRVHAGPSLETPDLERGIVGAADHPTLSLVHLDAPDRVLVTDHGHLAADGAPLRLDLKVPDFDGLVRAPAHLEKEKMHLNTHFNFAKNSCFRRLNISQKY